MNELPVIVKWEGGRSHKGNPVLFFPTMDANAGRLVCYAHLGQHSEADYAYYRGLRNPAGAYQQLEANNLLAEYRRNLDKGESLKIVSRDTVTMQRQRYGWIAKRKAN